MLLYKIITTVPLQIPEQIEPTGWFESLGWGTLIFAIVGLALFVIVSFGRIIIDLLKNNNKN